METQTPLLKRIPLAQLHESPLNPRKHYDEVALKQLAESLLASGQITPITVRPSANGKGGFEIAAGHRRTRAAHQAGLEALDAVVRDDLKGNDPAFIEILNVDNLQRDDLHPLEEAQGFRTLMEKAGYDIPKIASRIGKSTKYVYDRLKLLTLIPEAQKLFAEGAFEAGHAILLARIAPAEQKRAINGASNNDWRGVRGLFQHDAGDNSLGLEFAGAKRKPVSVREFESWIKQHVRFDVEKEDLPGLFPLTAEALAQAEAAKRKVVFITFDHGVKDDAKDPDGARTYGKESWKRADGEKGSKECQRSVLGVVAAGKGRGEAFLVCVNRDRCEVHYGPQVRARLAREAARAKEEASGKGAKPAKADAPAKEPKVDPNVIPFELEEEWAQEELEGRITTEAVPAIKKILGEIKLPDEIAWNMAVNGDLNFWRWGKVGGPGSRRQTDHGDELEQLLKSSLPGKFGHSTTDPKDAAGARSMIAVLIWLARDTADLDDSIDKAVEARWKAHRASELAKEKAAAAKKPKPAAKGVKIKKTGKLAGDVRRAKAKKAKART